MQTSSVHGRVVLNNDRRVRVAWLPSELRGCSLWKWQMFESMEQSWAQQKQMGTGGGEHETEILKNMLLETSPVLVSVCPCP